MSQHHLGAPESQISSQRDLFTSKWANPDDCLKEISVEAEKSCPIAGSELAQDDKTRRMHPERGNSIFWSVVNHLQLAQVHSKANH